MASLKEALELSINKGGLVVCSMSSAAVSYRALFDSQCKKLDPGFKPQRQAFVICSFCSKSIASDTLRQGEHLPFCTVEPPIKDTPNKGHLRIKHTIQSTKKSLSYSASTFLTSE